MLIIAAAGSNRFYWLVVTDAQSWSRRGPTRKRLVGAAHTLVLGQGAPPCSGECKTQWWPRLRRATSLVQPVTVVHILSYLK